MTDIGSVAVVAEATVSPFVDLKGGETGVSTGCSEVELLIEPAFELAALCGALDRPAAP